MIITPYKTHKIEPNENLYEILDRYLPEMEENSVVAVSSKIISICEGRVIKNISNEQRDKLIYQEAEQYIPKKQSKYEVMPTITRGTLIINAGVDESNSNGNYILWPKDSQESANRIRDYLQKKYQIKLGVVICDSKLIPLRWGGTGFSLSHSGFLALKSYVGKQDIFGRKMEREKANIADSLATAAVTVMGEGDEQQPLAVITDVPFVQFQSRNPTQAELDTLKIKLEDDVYAPLLTSVQWEKGGKNKLLF